MSTWELHTPAGQPMANQTRYKLCYNDLCLFLRFLKSQVNSHPQMSDSTPEFVVVHNGIITNFKELKQFLTSKVCSPALIMATAHAFAVLQGHEFVSETDTEVIAKLVKYMYVEKLKANSDQKPDFRELVEETVSQLEGAFALIFKSIHYPNQAYFSLSLSLNMLCWLNVVFSDGGCPPRFSAPDWNQDKRRGASNHAPCCPTVLIWCCPVRGR